MAFGRRVAVYRPFTGGGTGSADSITNALAKISGKKGGKRIRKRRLRIRKLTAMQKRTVAGRPKSFNPRTSREW